jgi:hypothetical protein
MVGAFFRWYGASGAISALIPRWYLGKAGSGAIVEQASSDSKRQREQFKIFACFVFFSALEIGYLFYMQPTFSTLGDWTILGGAIFFPIMAILSFFAMRNNWSDEQADRITMRTLGYVVLAPIALIVAVLVGIALFSAFGWFATIPSWAAVIIVLLVLIYLK